jgi:hypothetical protein
MDESTKRIKHRFTLFCSVNKIKQVQLAACINTPHATVSRWFDLELPTLPSLQCVYYLVESKGLSFRWLITGMSSVDSGFMEVRDFNGDVVAQVVSGKTVFINNEKTDCLDDEQNEQDEKIYGRSKDCDSCSLMETNRTLSETNKILVEQKAACLESGKINRF